MSCLAVVGCQWGDEGKGKVVDFLSQHMDIDARFQGGPNAGHTVKFKGQSVVFHQLPAGILNPEITGLVGAGCIIDPLVLQKELSLVESLGVSVKNRLFISPKTHLIMPYHKIMDEVVEESRGAGKIGTTVRGIGPCYEDKYARIGIRAGDLLKESFFREKLKKNLAQKNFLLMELYKAHPLSERKIFDDYVEYRKFIEPLINDIESLINRALADDHRVLLEGAQGALLDIDYGIYPYVTSSSPTAGGACVGLGIGPTKIDQVLGLAKAYTTRVGMGPFPTEESLELSLQLRNQGGEYGATTGRPRRCGWFDAPVVRYAAKLNGLDHLAITKLDVLDGFPELKIGVGYNLEGEEVGEFDPESAAFLKPRYVELKGWLRSTREAKKLEDLPGEARAYLDRIETEVGYPVGVVSVGEDREATILSKSFNFRNDL
jgi:adenylosuccinate synthase